MNNQRSEILSNALLWLCIALGCAGTILMYWNMTIAIFLLIGALCSISAFLLVELHNAAVDDYEIYKY